MTSRSVRPMGPQVAVVAKRTSYTTFVQEQKNGRVEALIAAGDPTVRRMRRNHDDHEETVREVTEALAALGARTTLLVGARSRIEGRFDLVVTIGGDGTLLGASHQLGPGTPLLGINSAPGNSVGFFCAGQKGDARATLEAALGGALKRVSLTRMRVDLNGETVHNRVLNEALFCHESPAATSKYILSVTHGNGETEEEDQRSSGIWVGPAAGSTAAQRSAGGKELPLSSKRLQYIVREPYTPLGKRFHLRMGLVDEDGYVVLRSRMHDARLFLDGHHLVHTATLGDVVTLRRSDEPLTVLGLERPH